MVGAGGRQELPHTAEQQWARNCHTQWCRELEGGKKKLRMMVGFFLLDNDGWWCIEMVGGGALPASVLHPPVLTCSALTSRRSASDRHFAC